MAKTYDTYKDSGIAWIGEIPGEWEVKRLGNFYNQRNEKVSDKDFAPLSVTMKGIVPQLETAAKTNDGDNRKLVRKGDFAINSRSDRRGSCGISDYDGSVSLINTVLCPKGEMDAGYYNWLFHTSMFADEYYKWGHGIVDDLWTTRWSEMKNIEVVNPPLSVQQSISSFLDTKCSEIDSLISIQEEMISELLAYKQSVITEAVTKGLDKKAKMKNSGVEWIGDIPEEWEVIKIQYLNQGLTDGTHGTYNRVDKGRLLLSSKNVREKDLLITDSESQISEEDYQSIISNGFPKKGDLLMCCIGASIGRCIIYKYDETYAFQRSVIFIRCNKLIKPELLRYNLLSNNSLLQELFLINQSAQAGLYQGQVKEIKVIVPPISKQKQIIDYLDKKTSQIDSLIALKLSKIESLKEYKKSIIYEYVTGKKRV